jgi:hypothetical protein
MAICRSSRRKFELVINQMTGNKLANHLGVRSSPAPTRRSTTAMGHKPTRKPVGVMSALPLQADLQRAPRQVRFVPSTEVVGKPIVGMRRQRCAPKMLQRAVGAVATCLPPRRAALLTVATQASGVAATHGKPIL